MTAMPFCGSSVHQITTPPNLCRTPSFVPCHVVMPCSVGNGALQTRTLYDAQALGEASARGAVGFDSADAEARSFLAWVLWSRGDHDGARAEAGLSQTKRLRLHAAHAGHPVKKRNWSVIVRERDARTLPRILVAPVLVTHGYPGQSPRMRARPKIGICSSQFRCSNCAAAIFGPWQTRCRGLWRCGRRKQPTPPGPAPHQVSGCGINKTVAIPNLPATAESTVN